MNAIIPIAGSGKGIARPDIDRIRKATMIAAELVEVEPDYLPIFLRLDAELRAAIECEDDPISRLRKRLEIQSATA